MDQLSVINFNSFIRNLQENPGGDLYLPPYIDFMQTLNNFEDDDGVTTQKMHAKNSIKWLQKFTNGFMQEINLKFLNPQLSFIENNHEELVRNSTGNNIPDFKFTLGGEEFTLEAKIYSSRQNFEDIQYGKSFHGAKFVLGFCLDDGNYYWRVRINNDVYSYSPTIARDEVNPELAKLIGWIKLPSHQTMLRIQVSSNATDDQLPETAKYIFWQVKAK